MYTYYDDGCDSEKSQTTILTICIFIQWWSTLDSNMLNIYLFYNTYLYSKNKQGPTLHL